jgi:hypothetical protein
LDREVLREALVLLSVVALMVVMLAMSVVPAGARPLHMYFCSGEGLANLIIFPYEKQERVKAGWECVKLPKEERF